MILHSENLERVRRWQRRGLNIVYLNVWQENRPNPAIFYGDVHASAEDADRAASHHPASYVVAYRLRIRFREGRL